MITAVHVLQSTARLTMNTSCDYIEDVRGVKDTSTVDADWRGVVEECRNVYILYTEHGVSLSLVTSIILFSHKESSNYLTENS